MLNSETVKLGNGRSWQVQSGGTGPALVWLHGLSGLIPGDPLVAGGRYDGLFTRLGSADPIAAVGFAAWIERLAIYGGAA